MAMEIEAVMLGGLDRALLRELQQRSDGYGLLQLALHAGLLAATGTLVWASHGSGWLVPAMLLHGIVLDFLFCAEHEAIHRTAFATRWLCDLTAWVCGALLLLPPRYFRLYHFAHHRFTQDPERDPELAQPPAATLAAYLWRVTGMPYWWDRLRVTLRHARGRITESFVPAAQAGAVVREARILCACYLAVIAVSVYLERADALIYWLLPALLGQPLLRLFLLAEHSGCALTADMAANTRTTRSLAAVRLLAWRMPYHAEHHCFPSVPFHALPRLNALVGERMQVRAPGYLAVHRQLVRQLRAAQAPGASRSSLR
jgi:fatty acid desaturase